MSFSEQPPPEPETDVVRPDLDASRGSVNNVGGTRDVHDERLRLRLKSYMEKNPHLTTAVLGRSNQSGVSRTALDLIMTAEYFTKGGPGGTPVNPAKSNVENKIRDFLDRVEGTENNGYSTAFTQTALWKQFQYACNTAISENIIVIAYGSPGHGKSRSLLQYQSGKLQTRAIEILCSANITTGYFVRKIAREMKISEHAIIPELEDQIADKLIKNKRPIIVDQANYLNEKALGTICHIWTRAQVGIVLIGTHDLKDLFTRLTTGKEDSKAQLTSRVALMVPLMGLSPDEAKTIIVKALGKYATSEAIAKIYKLTAGSYRHLGFMLPHLTKWIEKNADEIESGDVDMNVIIDSVATRMILE